MTNKEKSKQMAILWIAVLCLLTIIVWNTSNVFVSIFVTILATIVSFIIWFLKDFKIY